MTGLVGVAARRSPARFSRLDGALRVFSGHAELLALTAIVAFGAAARLVNLVNRASWDSDQAADATAVYAAVSQGRLPVVGPLSSVRSFHHGALYYDILLPSGWLGNGDPTVMALEIALLNILVILAVWWVARSIAGGRAGLTAAFLAAVSTAFVRFSIGLWNPFLIGPGAALALLGTYKAWESGRGRWWLVAALGVDVAAQAHIAASIIALPVLVAYVLAVVRSPRVARPRLIGWGLVGAGVVLVTLLPLIAEEVTNGFPEARGIVAYLAFGKSAAPPEVTRLTPHDFSVFVRVPLAAVRILAWPLTGWPMTGAVATFLVALTAALLLGAGLASRALAVRRSATAAQRYGVYLVGGTLLLLILLMGVALRDVSQIQTLPTEQYHAVADPFVIVAAAIILSSVAGARLAFRGRRIGPAVFAVALVGFAAWNVAYWPPLQAPDGGWPAATDAAHRIEAIAGGRTIALASLPEAKAPDAYRYPLMLDHAALTDSAAADVVVLLCDSYWVDNCGGAAEETWRAANGGESLKRVESFRAAPDRLLTVYLRER